MAKRVVIDPIPRIEGHLRIEVEVENGKVKDAWSSGTLFRGFEIILQGRDPRDAWFITQRICGVCPVSHGHTSTMALEDAFQRDTSRQRADHPEPDRGRASSSTPTSSGSTT